MTVIDVINLSKTYSLSNQEVPVLHNISFGIAQGLWAAIVGPSGSGKSTLLSILAGLESPSQGTIKILDQDLSVLTEDQKAQFRARNTGFIFQSFRLMPHLSAVENVQIPLEISGSHKNSKERAVTMLKRVGLGHRLFHRTSQLSGGEQQRVAIARAFVTQPKVLFADEPTGNLDSQNGEHIISLMKELQKENSSTLIVVTHDLNLAQKADLKIVLRDGVIVPS